MRQLLTLIADDTSPVVTTTAGKVRGQAGEGVQAFKGIPYAAPPTGALRFGRPQAAQSWSGVRDATKFGAACPQPRAKIVPKGIPISEDCLTVNVWTPVPSTRAGSGKKPVLVFIHGGGFVEGTAAEPIYDGADLARKGVVVVTLQYRFGPFGYLDLSDLGKEYENSANNGLLDQIAGLQWVRKNIAAFGGDPSNVTLFGESAGSISISAIMGSPQSDGLYHRAILQSGTSANISDRKQAGRVSRAYRDFAGASTVADLRKLSADKLQQAADDLYDSDFSDTAFGPVVDGQLLPENPMKRLASPDGPKVPVIITTTRDEARYWIQEVPEAEHMPEVLYRPWLTNLVGESNTDAAIAAYRKNRPDLTEGRWPWPSPATSPFAPPPSKPPRSSPIAVFRSGSACSPHPRPRTAASTAHPTPSTWASSSGTSPPTPTSTAPAPGESSCPSTSRTCGPPSPEPATPDARTGAGTTSPTAPPW